MADKINTSLLYQDYSYKVAVLEANDVGSLFDTFPLPVWADTWPLVSALTGLKEDLAISVSGSRLSDFQISGALYRVVIRTPGKVDRYPFMKGVRFFPFPSIKESKRRRKWLNAIRRPLDYSPKPWHRVCSRHFEDNADIPTLFPWNNYGMKTTSRDATSILKRENAKEYQNKNDDKCETGCTEMNVTETEVLDIIIEESDGEVNDIIVPTNVPFFIKEVEIETENNEASSIIQDHTYSNTIGARTTDQDHRTVSVAVQTDITLVDMKQYDENSSNLSFLSTIISSDKKKKTITHQLNRKLKGNCNFKVDVDPRRMYNQYYLDLV
ncbi:hypothetical protein KUTeg_006644 [Tegillarca granosa]|uniref:THAP-type domain-containing protein n=1 Tax=Tegillarca granosa TaxID=220873 RepID=A0ABQ9FAW7_TEGGR|nr:hypothetical protein KUTeg_006644 [Tegillarca granosa]